MEHPETVLSRTTQSVIKMIEDCLESLQSKQEMNFYCDKCHAGEEREPALHRAEEKEMEITLFPHY